MSEINIKVIIEKNKNMESIENDDEYYDDVNSSPEKSKSSFLS